MAKKTENKKQVSGKTVSSKAKPTQSADARVGGVRAASRGYE